MCGAGNRIKLAHTFFPHLILIWLKIVANTENLHETSLRELGWLDPTELLGRGIVGDHVIEFIPRDVRLTLSIQKPALLPCHRHIIDILNIVGILCLRKGVRDAGMLQKPGPNHGLLLICQADIGRFNVNTVLVCILIRIRRGTESDEEPNRLIAIEIKEISETTHDRLDEGLDMFLSKGTSERLILTVFEIQINQERLGLIKTGLFYQSKWRPVFHEEIVV